MPGHDIIVIGASAGGLDAIRKVAKGLPADSPAALFFVLHMSPHSPFTLPELIARAGPLPARGAVDGAPILPGTITVAPPDRHLLLEEGHVRVLRGPKENLSRPAIDPLFRTAARVYGPRVVGVILTGNLDNGTAGLQDVKARGGIAVVQDPEEAHSPSMPRSAQQFTAVDHVARLAALGPLLGRLALKPVRPEAAPPVPERIDLESRNVAMETNGVGAIDRLGEPSQLACPECHGALTRIEVDRFLRYRCHEGHAYTARAMAAEQKEVSDRGLWDLIRLFEERASLHAQMAAWSRQKNQDDPGAGRWEAEVARLKEGAIQIRNLFGQEAGGQPDPGVSALESC